MKKIFKKQKGFFIFGYIIDIPIHFVGWGIYNSSNYPDTFVAVAAGVYTVIFLILIF